MGKMKKILFISENAPDEMLGALRAEYEIRKLPPCDTLDRPVACHADMLVGVYCGRAVVSRPYFEKNAGIFRDIGPTVTEEAHGREYPSDVFLNFIDTGDAVVGYAKSVSAVVKKPVINVKQGYTRCSTLVAGKCAVSADKGILSALKTLGYGTLLIRPGHIALPGYDGGFIGGASFYDGGTAFFFGNINAHPDGETIKSFLSAHGISCVTLSGGLLTDHGGAVIIKIPE